jgi:isoleucyl-tRNA synthetase
MVAGRPDWLISRQRAWGTPIAMFVDKDTGEPLQDEAVNARIPRPFAKGGADAWYAEGAADVSWAMATTPSTKKVEDILDVWFDSGSTHAFTLEGRPDLKWPADLYLEGSDQHRGWFHSSLLEGCGTRGRAPYDVVLTHGFTLDEKGEKMSKSKGNVTIEPQDIIKDSGADILRLWVMAMVDYADDLRIGKEILQTNVEPTASCATPSAGCSARWRPSSACAATSAARTSRPSISTSAATPSTATAPTACAAGPTRTVMDAAFDRLTAWLAPLAAFTAEEAWTTRFPGRRPGHPAGDARHPGRVEQPRRGRALGRRSRP